MSGGQRCADDYQVIWGGKERGRQLRWPYSSDSATTLTLYKKLPVSWDTLTCQLESCVQMDEDISGQIGAHSQS